MGTAIVTTEAAAQVAYCSKCGQECIVQGQSLDPRYPFVFCSRLGDDGIEYGHRRVAGLLDKAEAERRQANLHRDRLAKAHPAHVAAGRRREDCPLCEADPPKPKAQPHGWERIQNRYRLASHLDLAHGDRAMLTNLQTRPYEDFAARHAELHGDPTIR